jgi:hypothetical protein
LSSQPSPTPCQVVTTFKQQQASKPHLCGHASRSELRHGQACRADAVEQARRDKDAAGAPPGVRRIQQATEHRAGAANAPPPLAARACRAAGQAAATATLQRSGSGSGSGSEPVPPAARPNPGRRLVRSSPLSSSNRRRSRAYADRPAGPSCAVGKHATPTQSTRLARTRGPPANRPNSVRSACNRATSLWQQKSQGKRTSARAAEMTATATRAAKLPASAHRRLARHVTPREDGPPLWGGFIRTAPITSPRPPTPLPRHRDQTGVAEPHSGRITG